MSIAVTLIIVLLLVALALLEREILKEEKQKELAEEIRFYEELGKKRHPDHSRMLKKIEVVDLIDHVHDYKFGRCKCGASWGHDVRVSKREPEKKK